MHLYFNNLSDFATVSSLIMSEILQGCCSCSKNFNLSQSSLGVSGKNIVEIPEATIAGN